LHSLNHTTKRAVNEYRSYAFYKLGLGVCAFECSDRLGFETKYEHITSGAELKLRTTVTTDLFQKAHTFTGSWIHLRSDFDDRALVND